MKLYSSANLPIGVPGRWPCGCMITRVDEGHLLLGPNCSAHPNYRGTIPILPGADYKRIVVDALAEALATEL